MSKAAASSDMLLNKNDVFEVLKEEILCKVLFLIRMAGRLGAEGMLLVSIFK